MILVQNQLSDWRHRGGVSATTPPGRHLRWPIGPQTLTKTAWAMYNISMVCICARDGTGGDFLPVIDFGATLCCGFVWLWEGTQSVTWEVCGMLLPGMAHTENMRDPVALQPVVFNTSRKIGQVWNDFYVVCVGRNECLENKAVLPQHAQWKAAPLVVDRRFGWTFWPRSWCFLTFSLHLANSSMTGLIINYTHN